MASSESSCKSSLRPSGSQFLGVLSLLSAWFPLLLAGALFFPTDPDLGYHLSIGKLVLEQGFPVTDIFRISSGAREIAYSWLPDVSLWLFYESLGVAGLRLWVCLSLFLLVVAASMLCLGIKSARIRWLLCFTLSIALMQLVSPRPRVLALVLFVSLVLVLLNRARNAGGKANTRFLFLIFVLSALWANVHISVFIAPGAAALFLLAEAVSSRDGQLLKAYAAALVVSLLATAANPYHWQLFSLLPVFAPGGQAGVAPKVIELQGFLSLRSPWPVWAYAAVALMLAWFTQLLLDVRRKRISSSGVLCLHLLTAVFFGLTFLASRHCGFFAVSAAATFTAVKQNEICARAGEAAVGVLVALLAVAAGWMQSPQAASWYEFDPHEKLPVAAVASLEDFLVQSDAGHRLSILSPFGTGHFITFWLRERGLEEQAGVFLDGRTDALGISRFAAATQIYSAESAQKTLDEHAIDIIVVETDSPLQPVLESSAEWRRLGGDERAAAFVRSKR